MFQRDDHLVLSQFEHSRLSGVLATLLGKTLRFSHPRLFGAIALHDWPHFADAPLADTMGIATKTEAQQRLLVGRLQGHLPLDAFTELIIRLHWRRLSDATWWDTIDGGRIGELSAQTGVDEATAAILDGWTDGCDALSFYLSFGESAAGQLTLIVPNSLARHELRWETRRDWLEIRGTLQPLACEVPFLAYESAGYPHVLVPVMRSFEVRCTT